MSPRSKIVRASVIALSVCLPVGLVATIAPAEASAPAQTKAETIAAPTVIVGTFNMFRGGRGLGNNSARYNLMASEIQRGNYDMIGLQETNTANRDAIQARLRATYNHSHLGSELDYSHSGGQIFYKKGVLKAESRQGIIALPRLFSDRSALYQEFTHIATGVHFLAISTHLTSGAGRANTNNRSAQTYKILNELPNINPNNLPVVFVGDMNSNRAKKYIYDAPALAFKARGIPDAATRTRSLPYMNFNSYNNLNTIPSYGGYRPDQIYVTPNIVVKEVREMVRIKRATIVKKVRKGKRIKRIKQKVTRYRTPFVSDHNAVRAIVTIPQTQQN